MPQTLRVESTAFEDGATIPRKYTADGEDVSPPLRWSAGPQGTACYALVCEDPDAPSATWIHWVAWNLAETSLPEGVAKVEEPVPGALQGRNSWGNAGWGGPAPPSGVHRYVFRVFALDERIDLGPDAQRDDLLKAINGHVLAQGQMVGRYRRHE